MCGRAYGPRFVWTWPNARIAVMGGEQAAMVLNRVRRRAQSADDAADDEAYRDEIKARYERQSEALYASARLWDDGVIDPVNTRDIVAECLTVATAAPLPPEAPLGILRM